MLAYLGRFKVLVSSSRYFLIFISESGDYETPSFPLSSDFKSIESLKTSSKEKKIQKNYL